MRRKGIALVLVFIVFVTLAGLTIAILSRSISEINLAKRYLNSTQAFWLSEAGVNKALYAVNNNDWLGWSTDLAGNKTISETLGAIGDYYIQVSNPSSNSPSVTSAGYTPNIADPKRIERALDVVLLKDITRPFAYAGFGKAAVVMG